MERAKATGIVLLVLLNIPALVGYAAIEYFGQIKTTIPVGQSILVDGKAFNETIIEVLPVTYGGCTVLANHTLTNRGDEDAMVAFTILSITDSQGNLVTGNNITVSWRVGNNTVQKATVPAHQTLNFSIAIHFHYAIAPDTYTVYTRVIPYIP